MENNSLEFVIEKTHELINAPTCSKEAAMAAKAWLASIGTDSQEQETKKYIAELEEDLVTIDNLIGFSGSSAGEKCFGKETAKNINEHAKEIKAQGAKYCDCPACVAVVSILDKKEALLTTSK